MPDTKETAHLAHIADRWNIRTSDDLERFLANEAGYRTADLEQRARWRERFHLALPHLRPAPTPPEIFPKVVLGESYAELKVGDVLAIPVGAQVINPKPAKGQKPVLRPKRPKPVKSQPVPSQRPKTVIPDTKTAPKPAPTPQKSTSVPKKRAVRR